MTKLIDWKKIGIGIKLRVRYNTSEMIVWKDKSDVRTSHQKLAREFDKLF